MTLLDTAPLPPIKCGIIDRLSPTAWLLIAATAALLVCLALAIAYRNREAR